MSASEWDRITEERDGALYHLRLLIDAVLDNEYAVTRAKRAQAWIDEEFGEGDE